MCIEVSFGVEAMWYYAPYIEVDKRLRAVEVVVAVSDAFVNEPSCQRRFMSSYSSYP